MSKSNDGNVATALAAIKEMSTVEEINDYISEEATTKNRSTVLNAAAEKIEKIQNPPAPEDESDVDDKESPAATKKDDKTRTEEYEAGQSLGRVHDRENYEEGLKSKK